MDLKRKETTFHIKKLPAVGMAMLAFLLAATLLAPRSLCAAAQPQLGMGSGNIGDGYTSGMVDCKTACLGHFNCPSTRLTTSDFFSGTAPTPQNMDWVIQKTSAAGISGIFLFDYYMSQGPMLNYAQWYSIGAAYAARFQPNSAWMTANTANPALGVSMWQAFNEPDNTFYGTQIPLVQYHDALHGLADGIHSVNAALKVYPGGYSRPNAQKDYTCGGYCGAVLDLLNDGTLAGIDLHTYFGPSTPIGDWNSSSQHNFDAVKQVCGITRDIEACVTESGYGLTGEGCGNCPISETISAAYNLTALWDGLGLVGNAGQSVGQLAHTFTLVLEDPSQTTEPDLAFTVTQCPWVANPRGLAIKMAADLTQGMAFESLDPKAHGVYTLTGTGANKKIWVWQNRVSWTDLPPTTYLAQNIPAGAAALQVYNSTGLVQTIPLTGQTSYSVTGLTRPNTYMIAAVGTPLSPTITPTFSVSPTTSPTPTTGPPPACPHQFNFESPATVGNWTTLNQGLPPGNLVISNATAQCGYQSLKAPGSISSTLGEWVYNIFPSLQDISSQGLYFEAWVRLEPAFTNGNVKIFARDNSGNFPQGSMVNLSNQSGWVHVTGDFTSATLNSTQVKQVGLIFGTGNNWSGNVYVDEFDWHLVTPTPTPTITTVVSATPSRTMTPTSTPSPTARPSGSQTPSPTTTQTQPTTTPSPTSTLGTASPTPTLTPVTATMSATVTETLTASPTPTQTVPPLSPTCTASPGSATPAATQTPSAVPASSGGQGIIDVVPVPNPNPKFVLVKLDSAVDSMEMTIYTDGLAAIEWRQVKGILGPGWTRLAVDTKRLSFRPNGSYFFEVAAKKGSSQVGKRVIGTMTLLH